MAMLAEPKRKQRWTLNPRGKQWSEDSNKFGQKMLEKMGWTSGKGLGANEQGMIEHVRVKFKDDAGGIGYSKDDQDKNWTEHQENFNDLLQKLQAGEKNSDEKALPEIKTSTDLSGKSLEMKSRQSRARVHYQKFTRGKDVNKYSTKDLANIFGKKDLQEAPEVLEPVSADPPATPIGASDTTGGILTTKGGSMTDYFKSKFPNFQLTPKKIPREEEKSSESESERYVGFGFSSPSISSIFSLEKTKLNQECIEIKTPKKRKSEFYVETPNSSSNVDEMHQRSKKLKSSGDFNSKKLEFESSVPGNSEKSNKIEQESVLEIENEVPAQELIKTEGKKSKKRKQKEKLNLEISEVQKNYENSLEISASSEKKSKKKTKKEIEPVECIPQSSPAIAPGNSLEPPKKPPRIFLKAPGNSLESPDPSSLSEIPNKSRKHQKRASEIEKLELESPAPRNSSITPKKSKKNNFEGDENLSDPHVVDLVYPEPEESLELEPPAPETKRKSKKSKKKDLEIGKKSSETGKSPQKFVFENPGLDLNSPEVQEVSLEVRQSLKKSKSKKNNDCDGIVNAALNLNSIGEENSRISSIFEVSRDSGDSREGSEGRLEVLKKPKRKKIVDVEGFVNPALNLDSKTEENSRISRNFETSRDSGVSNDALDLSDEYSNKKRVTFNDEIEYNTDLSKKKKKRMKRKLDKFEVENNKLRSNKTKKEGEGGREIVGYVNPVLEDDIISEEIIDNEENEKKIRKNERRRKRRISQLETIEEISEEEGLGGAGGETNCEKKRKKSKNKGEENFPNFEKENWEVNGLEKKVKKEAVALGAEDEGRQEVLQVNNSEEFFGPGGERDDRSKKKLKSLFSKSPVLHFQGSNINEIKGYGVEV